jgi:hypothetical protein
MQNRTKFFDYTYQFIQAVIIGPLYVIFIPWEAVFRPMKALLNAPDEDQKNRLAEIWMERKLSELIFVGVTVRRFSFLLHQFTKYTTSTSYKAYRS